MLKKLSGAFLALALISALVGTGAATTLKGNDSRDGDGLRLSGHDHGSTRRTRR